MLINNLEKLEKHLKIISGLATSERSFSDKRLKLLQEFYSDLKTLKSNFEARSLSLYIRSILKIPFIDKYPKNAHALGMIVHYGPGNLPINSIYSWITGFLCGNVNLVRSSTRTTPQQLEIITLISDLCKKHNFVDTFSILKDAHGYAKLTSKYCQARVIWGSNSTVKKIRKIDCDAKCRDIIFSDRKSAAIYNFDTIEKYDANRKKFFITALANDLLYANSEPCTAPSVIFLISKTHEKKNLLEIMKGMLIEAEVLANKKEVWDLLSFSKQVEHLQYYAINKNQPTFLGFESSNSKLAVVSSPTFQKRLFRTFEIVIVDNFSELSHHLLNKFNIFICEGLTTEQKLFLISNNNCTKITSAGQAHQFGLIWDGIDTVTSLIRIPEIS